MKDKYSIMMTQYLKTEGALKHLRFKNEDAHRRTHYEIDFQSLGRPFLRDNSVIMCSPSKRREGFKTQVTTSDAFCHMRNRTIHSGEVRAHAQRLGDHLGLNVDLIQSGSEGHDFGHVPFGHQGENWIRKITGKDFTHEKMGVIIAQKIERGGKGLNLTWQTLDAMMRHSGDNAIYSMSQEAWIIRWADKFAYLFSDFNDFQRLGWKSSQKLTDLMNWFGHNQRDRTFRTMVDFCTESAEAGRVQFETSETAIMFAELRKEMYEVYVQITMQDVSNLLEPIYALFERTKHIPPDLGVALLTEPEVKRMLAKKGLLDISDVMRGTGVGEIISKTSREHLFSIDITDPDLDW